MSWLPSPEFADWWYDLSWKGIISFGAVAAFAAAATVIFMVVQFWSDGIKDEIADARNRTMELKLAEAETRAAEAQRETERLRKENLRLQYSLQSRRIIMGSRDGDQERRAERFEAVRKYNGTLALIQSVPDFEAQTLASDIQVALTQYAEWRVKVIDEVPVGYIREGVRIVTNEAGTLKYTPDGTVIGSSPAGDAGRALASLLALDLGPPYGSHFAVNWEWSLIPAITKVIEPGAVFDTGWREADGVSLYRAGRDSHPNQQRTETITKGLKYISPIKRGVA
jgi:hypothetical protein